MSDIDSSPEKILINTFLYPDICINKSAMYIAGSAKSSPILTEPFKKSQTWHQ
jgi:hypothetical protein